MRMNNKKFHSKPSDGIGCLDDGVWLCLQYFLQKYDDLWLRGLIPLSQELFCSLTCPGTPGQGGMVGSGSSLYGFLTCQALSRA